tara:strand:- start:209 stop:460 length:252 start_codon:yes stop_codon:yes gene_type:complete
MQSELQMQMYTALVGCMKNASHAQMAIMGDLIRLGFGVEWTTDHQLLLAEKVGMGLITKEQKAECQDWWAEMALELSDYHSEQ